MAKFTSPTKLAGFDTTTVSFDDLAAYDGEEFSFKAGQPYAALGLSLYAASVAAAANLNSGSKKGAASSTTIYTFGLQNSLFLAFSPPQRIVGFYYRSKKAQKLQVRALDAVGNQLEDATFAAGDGYAGIVRPSADIEGIQLLAPHRTFDDAVTARTQIDDLSFASVKKKERTLRVPRGLPELILGGVRVDGGGIRIGPGGVDPVPPWTGHLGQILAAARILADAELLPDGSARSQLVKAARSMLEAGLARLAKERASK